MFAGCKTGENVASLKHNLEILKAAGLAVPTTAHRFAEDQDYRQRCIKSVWKCNCGYVYESEIPVLDFDHACGKVAHRVWLLTDGFSK